MALFLSGYEVCHLHGNEIGYYHKLPATNMKLMYGSVTVKQ